MESYKRECYFYKYYPNDMYVSKYGMSYRNFIRILPITDDNCYHRLLKTISMCMISNRDKFSDYVNYLRLIGTDIFQNMDDSDIVFSIRKHIEISINSFLTENNIDRNKSNMFYEDSFLLISHECQDIQNRQVSHLIGKTVNKHLINNLSDIVCFPPPYFKPFDETINETKKPQDAISLKLDYVVNFLEGKITPEYLDKLVDVLLKISQELYDIYITGKKNYKGIDLFSYTKRSIKLFLEENNLCSNGITEPFYDECFLITIYKVQEETMDILSTKKNEPLTKENTNQEDKLKEKKDTNKEKDTNLITNSNSQSAHISKTAAYILATLVCVIAFFIYISITVIFFRWKSGGGVLPLFVLFSVLGYIWKWIVNFSKSK